MGGVIVQFKNKIERIWGKDRNVVAYSNKKFIRHSLLTIPTTSLLEGQVKGYSVWSIKLVSKLQNVSILV